MTTYQSAVSLRVKEPLTEQILTALSEFSDMIDIPRNLYQVLNRDAYVHYRGVRRERDRVRREQARIQKALWNLERAAYITLQRDSKGKKKYRLSPKGWLKFAIKYAQKIKQHERDYKHVEDFKRGNFVIIFDIPETYRHFRDTLRKVLYQSGCAQLQKSIFTTSSVQAAQFIARVVANCELEDRVKILLVKSIL